MTRLPSALLLAAALAAPALAQRAAAPAPPAVPAPPVTVDRSGVLRWTADGSEVALFGVNYAAPFAYDFRAIRAVGGDVKHTIATDVAHLARLGVTAYRIHVWDKEVSDSAGNLLANEHLDHFDVADGQVGLLQVAVQEQRHCG